MRTPAAAAHSAFVAYPVQEPLGHYTALDQLRTVDRERPVGCIEHLPKEQLAAALKALGEFFAP
jgi:mRNA-degrading endonuclease toxin of MazEF toxin-antitoxin module